MHRTAADTICRHHVQLSGQDAPTLLFSHGFGADQTLWRRLIPAFEPHYRVVSFDQVGAGRACRDAGDPERHASLWGYAEDVLDVVRAIGGGPVIGVGHSAGAMAMLLASLRDPQAFSRLVLIGASPRYLNDPPHYRGGFERSDLDELLDLIDQNFQQFVGLMAPLAMAAPAGSELTSELGNSFGSMDPAAARRWARAIFLSDHRDDMARVRVPCLLLQCRDDAIVPLEVGEWMGRHLPGSTLRWLDAVGHFPHMTQPGAVIAAIRSWLQAQTP